jgi:FlaG/FlaF family flagellin (archaellin)
MVAPASARSRPPVPLPTVASRSQKSRPIATYVLIAVPVLLAATFLWQIASNVFHTEDASHPAVGVSQVTLEPDPSGTRVDLVMVDRIGQETTFDGNLSVSLREPDGAVWQTSRTLSNGDFKALPDDSLMAGRTGYTFVVSSRDWARPPRRGGLATISVNATPSDGSPTFTSQSQQRFP